MEFLGTKDKHYANGFEQFAKQFGFTDRGEHYTGSDLIHVFRVKQWLEQLPTTGHWITTRNLMHDGEYYCDICKCDSPNNEKWDYGPNCGAMMIESEDKE